MGYMTKSQFRQCLSYLELPATDEEMLAIEDRFSNDKGFNYLQVSCLVLHVACMIFKFCIT